MEFPITFERADYFAEKWIAAWNSRDLDRVLSFYSDDINFYSPLAVEYPDRQSGQILGLDALRAYWTWCLETLPDLYFSSPERVITNVYSVCLIYQGAHDLMAVETMVFNRQGKISHARCHYYDCSGAVSYRLDGGQRRVSNF